MDPTQAINPYSAVSSTNFERRFCKLFRVLNRKMTDRFCAALDDLKQAKATLVAKFSKSPLIGYQVRGGLGAVCITCVEEYVTSILVRNGFKTQILARQLPYDLWGAEQRRPGIHAYNIVKVCGTDFVVDLDADPFVGRNVGIVVVPLQNDVPWYSSGFLYHCRNIDKRNRITFYRFSFQDEDGRIHHYFEGDTAEYLTIAPYHNASDQSLCPLCFAGGTTVYFGFEKNYIGSSGPYYRIPFTLVCPTFPGEKDCTYQLTIGDVQHIRVYRQQPATGEHQRLSQVVIAILLTNGCKIQFLLANNGMLVANDFVSFAPTGLASPSGFKSRLSAKDGPEPHVILPRPSHA